MGTRVGAASKAVTLSFDQTITNQSLISKPFSLFGPRTQITISNNNNTLLMRKERRESVRVMFVKKKSEEDSVFISMQVSDNKEDTEKKIMVIPRTMRQRNKERNTYLVAALMSSLGFSFASIIVVYLRFYWQMKGGGEFPLVEMFCTFSLAVGSAVGMEFWARWAHRVLWHASLWHMHESHHRARDGPFEVNDVFAIVNAIPAIALLSYGLFNDGFFSGLCFGAGLGITMFGMAYMFVHDGLVHRRFPVGPIANVPYLRKVAAAHQIHHSEKFQGVPYGLFLGPKEVEAVGGMEELKKEIEKRIKQSNS